MFVNKFKKAKRLFIPVFIGLLLFTSLVINIISPSLNFNFIPVTTKNGLKSDSVYLASVPVIKEYEKAVIKGDAMMVMRRNSILNFIAPKSVVIEDNLYALAGIAICLIFCINLWNYDESKPFTIKFLKTIEWTERILLLTWIINIIRIFIIRTDILRITNLEYTFDIIPFAKPEFWLWLFFAAFARLIKRGILIQQEQDLTV